MIGAGQVGVAVVVAEREGMEEREGGVQLVDAAGLDWMESGGIGV
jgi:hypothetical protein